MDAQVGRLLDTLDRLKLGEDTIVVFWSDHGYHLGEHNGIWQKRTLFEQGARAPLIIRVPGTGGAGKSCRRIVEFVDIYPTICDAAGVKPKGSLNGVSLMPLLERPARAWKGYAVTQVLRPADQRLASPVMGCSVRSERYRYTEWGQGEFGVELYDHQSDPGEFDNLARNPDSRAQAVIEQLRPILRDRASGKVPQTPFNPKRL